MALKQRFIEIFLSACLVLCYTAAQDTTTPQNSYGCQNVTCSANQVCRMIEVQCFVAPCYPVPSCVDSAPVCGPDPCGGLICLHGRATDNNGCLLCGCIQPCYGVTCPDGYECEPTTDATTKTHTGQCVPAVTRPQCATYNCDNSTNCRFGFKLDHDGCQMGCQCYDPCEGFCPENKRCSMTADDCPKGDECRDGPMRVCEDISDLSSTPTSSDSRPTDAPVCYPEYCTLNCTNGRVTDENGCLRCQCRVCGDDPCAGLICLYGKARDGNGCITCGCYEPCSGFPCPEGQECHPTHNSATNTTVGQCFPTVTRPPCQKVTCDPIVCLQGFLSDVNGCKTCECRDLCKLYPPNCRADQHCVVPEDDCPKGEECRDAPMPHCVDGPAATLPPTPQLSTTVARGERGEGDGQETVRQCCSSVGMSDACLTVCSTNITLLYSNLETLSGCFQYLGAFLHCASGGRSHINCCSQRGISESCLYLCSGNESFDISNPHAVTQCVISSSQTVLGCFDEGLTDANMTVPQTSTPSSTTAEDICSLPPDTGRCRSINERWYYSAVDRACATFNYGGCEGNGNNFLTRDDCLARCSRSGSVCPDVHCPSSCQISVDQYGCHSCYGCGDDCMTNGCPEGQDCKMQPGSCPANVTNCPLAPLCVPRPDVICYGMSNCTLSCPTGWMTDSNKCPICQCKPCPPVCEGMVCLYGRTKGWNGCDTCDCYNPCQTLSCPDQCRVMKNNATGVYYGECYSGTSTPASTPVSRPPKPLLCLSGPDYGMSCQSNSTRWFYNQSANACSSFSFGGCQGNDNNFQTKPICEAMCKDSTCPQLDCRSIQNCPYGMMTDNNGCPICQCLDPCQGMECLGNTVCVSRKSDCADNAACRDPFTRSCIDPSLTSTTAAPPSTTPLTGCPPMCRMYCSHGYEKDSNGCDTCICQDPCKNCTAAQTCVRMAIDCPVNDRLCADSFMGFCVDKTTAASSPTPTSAAVTSPTTESSTTKFRCPLCGIHCPYLALKDANGCICHCYEPCAGVNCNGNSTCQVIESDCSTDPQCPPNVRFRGQCVDTTTTTSTSNSTTPSTTGPGLISCPYRQLCSNRCPYGNAKNSNGCYTCDCDDPCLRVTCNSTQTCERMRIPGYCEGDMCWEAYNATCIQRVPPVCGPVCMIYCTYGNVRDANGCPTCDCNGNPCASVLCPAHQQCVASQLQNDSYFAQCIDTTTQVPIPTKQATSGPTGVTCGPVCMMYCPFGMVRDSNGCPKCECNTDPCAGVSCRANQQCVSSQPPDGSHYGQCTDCPMPMCMSPCFYGTKPDAITGCPSCECRMDPCSAVRCMTDLTCQALLFCPDNVCTPSPVCVDRSRPCDGLEKAYERTFGNNLGMMPQMNCDSRGLFQPIQCSDYDCWCVDEFGTPTSNRSSMELNCYSGNQTVETLKIETDINVIKLGEGWRFKQQVSHQLSNMLGIDESLVTVRKYVKGSIMATVVIGSNANTDMMSVQQKLNLAKQTPFSIAYDEQTYQAILLGGPVAVTPGTPGSNSNSAGGNLLMIILICVFVPVGLVAIAATIWLACKICRDKRIVPPRRLSEKSGASTEINSLESGSDKSYNSDTFSSTITKDEKVAVVDTTEA